MLKMGLSAIDYSLLVILFSILGWRVIPCSGCFRNNLAHLRALITLTAVLFLANSSVAESPVNNLFPVPALVNNVGGVLPISHVFTICNTGYFDQRLNRASIRLISRLHLETGNHITEVPKSEQQFAQMILHCDGPGENIQAVDEDETYTLDVRDNRVLLSAHTPVGMFRGIETFLQLVNRTPSGFGVSKVHIKDYPRYKWRGLLIDPARHFLPVPVVERVLDGMACVKLNVLHWHLSDDQGFRVESKVFPNLQGQGSDGQYYTQDQIKQVVAYASDRGIRVVPEFDMPGHTTSWFVGYPELASGPGPYSIRRGWGVSGYAMDPTRDETYQFLDKFIGEMANLFPDRDFHIGGDEVNAAQWDGNPAIQQFKTANGIPDNRALQAYFNRKIQKILANHGKYPVGWDEVLTTGVPTNLVVESWHGNGPLSDAVKQGHFAILASGYYLDYPVSAANYYMNDPLQGVGNLSSTEQDHILGGEACMWGERIVPENIDARIWPRCAAIAERLWSPATVKDPADMYRRLPIVEARLEAVGSKPRSSKTQLLAHMASPDPVGDLDIATDLLQVTSGSWFGDVGQEPNIPLTSVLPNESLTARQFSSMVSDLPLNEPEMRKDLQNWRASANSAAATAARHEALRQYVPDFNDIVQTADIGIDALDRLKSGSVSDQAWVLHSLDELNGFSSAGSAVQIAIAKPVADLVLKSLGPLDIVPLTTWRWMPDDGGKVDPASLADPKLDVSGLPWQDASTGDDIFHGRVGYAWCRVVFPISDRSPFMIHFDSIDDNADVYLNGKLLRHHEGWNDPFDIPISTANWNISAPNVLCVRVQNTSASGGINRAATIWYSKAGH